MHAKGRIRHKACLRSSARNLPCHILADVDQRRQQARIRAQRYRETHTEMDGGHFKEAHNSPERE